MEERVGEENGGQREGERRVTKSKLTGRGRKVEGGEKHGEKKGRDVIR